MIVGQDRAVEAFTSAWSSRRLHHAWLLAGPKGVGKASFARERRRGYWQKRRDRRLLNRGWKRRQITRWQG